MELRHLPCFLAAGVSWILRLRCSIPLKEPMSGHKEKPPLMDLPSISNELSLDLKEVEMTYEKKSKEKMSLKELVGLARAIVRWGALSIGGLCLLMYTDEIGQFPEGLDLGEGLAFYLVCVGFFIVYSFYLVGLTTAGCLLFSIPLTWAQKNNQRRNTSVVQRRGSIEAPTDFSPMWDMPVAVVGGVSLLLIGLYVASNPKIGWTILPLTLCQGIFVAMIIRFHRQRLYLQSGLIVTSDIPYDTNKRLLSLLFFQRLIAVLLFVFPLLMGPEKMFLVDTAFRIAKLRKDDATIHVQKPWTTRVSESTLTPTASFLGENYMQFKNVKVLLRSVGEKVVIELPQAGGIPSVKLPVPSSHIVVE